VILTSAILCLFTHTVEDQIIIQHTVGFRRCWNKELPEPDEAARHLLIYALCRMGRTDLACHHFHEVVERVSVPNKYTYTFLIGENCKERNWVEAAV
jgi:pentatricopeptide repeat protein